MKHTVQAEHYSKLRNAMLLFDIGEQKNMEEHTEDVNSVSWRWSSISPTLVRLFSYNQNFFETLNFLICPQYFTEPNRWGSLAQKFWEIIEQSNDGIVVIIKWHIMWLWILNGAIVFMKNSWYPKLKVLIRQISKYSFKYRG